MPSFLSRLGGTSKKMNPYTNPYHPGHNPIPESTSTNTTASSASHNQTSNTLRMRPASPRGSSDLLAEARQVAGRDPVTGRRRADMVGPTASERASLAELRQVDEEERTAYQDRAAASKQTTGSNYDLFVQEAIKKREVEASIRAARGGIEYYAPERRVEEFYAGGVRD
ncbi:uncharacterized protein K460DRAFT_129195 [Cucurbitaria berberidis CBS 394.84]|uniref:Uncharacterized protein n=1 Tax=Cucurbitaria berberidis CBS 394.84 TaxID=1168544 RepID=A0A9P4GKD5_9PLEO|nr:uncharacterized protein K460DRAFT_129195 [Cucurbitaria berberidis CBS 394.84]KAF1846731.1 hypothetical protein K460DRAFT_129195 [Cucurbitaria berberidis CBS 394.84]